MISDFRVSDSYRVEGKIKGRKEVKGLRPMYLKADPNEY